MFNKPACWAVVAKRSEDDEYSQHAGLAVRRTRYTTSSTRQNLRFRANSRSCFLVTIACSLASIFFLSVIIVAAVVVLNARRFHRQVSFPTLPRSTTRALFSTVFLCFVSRANVPFEPQEDNPSSLSRPESSYLTASVWLFVPAAVTRCVLLCLSALSNS